MKREKTTRRASLGQKIRRITLWLTPGLGVKRWFGLVLAGVTLLGVGVAIFLLELYRTAPEVEWYLNLLATASLRFLPRPVRVIIFGSAGIGLIIWGLWGVNRSVLLPFLRPGSQVVDQLAEYRRRERGPRVVAIGGGHGLANLLRGLKDYTHNLTAVVSVADDGGSSGELRRTMGILPPGDIRNCLAALSNDEALLTQLFQFRFSGTPGLDGHSFGNLFITALSEITGSFEEAVAESGRVLSVHGRVLPATLHDVQLVADVQIPHLTTEIRVAGESRIPEFAGRVRRVWLEPDNPPAFPPVIQTILAADVLIIGPGSLYTSIVPNLLVPDIRAAVRASQALKIFVCNIANQAGETQHYTCQDHVDVLEEYLGKEVIHLILCNNVYDADTHPPQWVRLDETILKDPRLYCADLVDPTYPWRHDPVKLAQTIMNLYYERTGPLS